MAACTAMPHVTVLVAAGCVIVAFIFQIIGVAAVGWVNFDSALGDYNDGAIGLWRACNERSGCQELPFVPAWLGAVRAFAILGVLAIMACLACVVLHLFVLKNMKIFRILKPSTAAAASLCGFLEVVIFGAMAGGRVGKSEQHSYGYCLPLTVISFIVCIVAAVLFVVSWRLDACDDSGDEKSSSTQGLGALANLRKACGRVTLMFRSKI